MIVSYYQIHCFYMTWSKSGYAIMQCGGCYENEKNEQKASFLVGNCREWQHQGSPSLYRYGALTEVALSSWLFINLFRPLLSLSWPPLPQEKSSIWEGGSFIYLLNYHLQLSIIIFFNLPFIYQSCILLAPRPSPATGLTYYSG